MAILQYKCPVARNSSDIVDFWYNPSLRFLLYKKTERTRDDRQSIILHSPRRSPRLGFFFLPFHGI